MKRKGSDFLSFFPDVRGFQQVHALPDAWIVDLHIEHAPTRSVQRVCGADLPALASGHRWVYWVPRRGNSTLLAFLNAGGDLVWVYADLIAGSGTDPGTAFPWVDDLYLDVVARPERGHPDRWTLTDAEVIDQEDLQDAVKAGRLRPSDAPALLAEAEGIRQTLLGGSHPGLHALRAFLSASRTPAVHAR